MKKSNLLLVLGLFLYFLPAFNLKAMEDNFVGSCCPMAQEIQTIEDVRSGFVISGKTLGQLQEDLYGLETQISRNLSTLSKEFSPELIRMNKGILSTDGFLADNENLIDVLKADWQTVAQLGLTHIELANHLSAILQKTYYKPEFEQQKKDLFEEVKQHCKQDLYQINQSIENLTDEVVYDWLFKNLFKAELHGVVQALCRINSEQEVDDMEVLYNVNKLNGNLHADEPQDLVIERLVTQSSMQDPIYPNENWNTEYTIYNKKFPEIKVIIAGNIECGIIRYIRNLGFYEGNVEDYRVDPRKLVAILTGKREYLDK